MIRQFYKLSMGDKQLFEDLWTLCAHKDTKLAVRHLVIRSDVFAGFLFRLAESKFRRDDFVLIIQHIFLQKLNEYVKKYPVTMLIRD